MDFKELFDGNGVLLLQKIADFLESFERLVRAALNNVVDDVHDVFVQIAQVLFGLCVLQNLLELLVLSDGLPRQRVDKLFAFVGFYHFL